MVYQVGEIRIPFNEAWVAESVEFAGIIAPVAFDSYSSRDQWDIIKQLSDHLIGKIGEFVARDFVIVHVGDAKVTFPDTTVYENRSNVGGYKPDLVGSDSTIYHVKSQNVLQLCRFPRSWVFQKSDPVTWRCEVKPHDKVIFVSVDVMHQEADIMVYMSASKLLERNLYTRLWLDKLNKTKTCVCYDNIRCACDTNCKECERMTLAKEICHYL